MKKAFNLKKYMKIAFYEDGRGYWNTLSRAWSNCYKSKSDDGMPPQKAWNTCLGEYQEASGKGKWAIRYASKDTGVKK